MHSSIKLNRLYKSFQVFEKVVLLWLILAASLATGQIINDPNSEISVVGDTKITIVSEKVVTVDSVIYVSEGTTIVGVDQMVVKKEDAEKDDQLISTKKPLIKKNLCVEKLAHSKELKKQSNLYFIKSINYEYYFDLENSLTKICVPAPSRSLSFDHSAILVNNYTQAIYLAEDVLEKTINSEMNYSYSLHFHYKIRPPPIS